MTEKSMTGNAIVDAVAKLNLQGNIIPFSWYKAIAKNGRPQFLAMHILADIVYWYRPTEVYDEVSGKILGYKKKFKADLLQKSYDSMAQKFNVSKRQITDAVVFLESLGVLKRVFRAVKYGELMAYNVLFIGLNPEKLAEISWDYEEIPEEENAENCETSDSVYVTPLTKKRDTPLANPGDTPTQIRDTNTNNTTNNTTNSFKDCSELTNVTSEQEAPLADVEPILTNKGEGWRPTQEEYEAFCRYHPNVDVKAEIVKMASWAFGNPKKRKTSSGMRKFVTTWLDKEQDRNRGNSVPRSGTQISKTENTRSEMNRIFEEMRSGT